MHEEVAGDTGAVVVVEAPAEEARRLEGPLRRLAQEAIPVDRLRRGVLRNRPVESTRHRVPVRPALDQVDLSDGAGGEQLAGLRVDDRAHALAAHLQDPSGLLLRREHPGALVDRVHHRLLAVDVLARLEGVDRHLHVPVVGARHDHRVHVLAGEHLAVVAGQLDVLAELPLALLEAAVVDVGGGDELDPGDLERRLGVALAHPARPEECQPDAVVGRDGLGRLLRERRPGGAGQDRGGPGELQELPAGGLRERGHRASWTRRA